MLLNYLSSFIFLMFGMQIIITKDISFKGVYVNLGNWSYLLGGIFILLGVYIIYTIKKRDD